MKKSDKLFELIFEMVFVVTPIYLTYYWASFEAAVLLGFILIIASNREKKHESEKNS